MGEAPNVKDIEQALRNVFGDGQDSAILIQRVPLICQDIKAIHEKVGEVLKNQEDVKEVLSRKQDADEAKKTFVDQRNFDPLKKNVEDIQSDIKWVIRLILGAVILGILALLFKS